MQGLTVDRMNETELGLVLDWAAREGWNPGLRDAEAFYPVDPGGFFLARIHDEPVGAISAVAYDDSFGFIGFFIVTPDRRGGRVGVELGRAAMQHLARRNVGLDGVLNKVKAYENLGFKVAWNNYRYSGNSRRPSTLPEHVRPVEPSDLPAISAYDRACFPSAREAFLQTWTTLPGHRALCCIEQGRFRGFGVIRPCRSGCKIGPLEADTPGIAERLFLALQTDIPEGTQIFLDTPGNHADAVALAQRQGMSVVFGTARMYNQVPPPLQTNRIFGIASFELG